MSRTDNSVKNVKLTIFFQALSILTAFFTRRIFVLFLTQEYLGLDGTFANILSMLSLAELGVGEAITYSLYKPLAENNQAQIISLIALYRRIYRAIGITIAILGSALTPFLSVIIRNLPDIPHIRLIYLLFVLNTTLSYFYIYKQSLIIADQKRYIITVCRYGLKILLFILQALFLWVTHNYLVYLGLQIGITLLENLLLSHQADKLYPYINSPQVMPLEQETKQQIIRNVRAMLFHKIGGVVVFGTDNLLISYFIGAVAVGLYSNYLMVINGLKSIYSQLFTSLLASVGNLGATTQPEQALPVFQKVQFLCNWLYGFSAICLIILFNPFIALWVGESYQFSETIVFLIVLNFYVTGMRQATGTFHHAYGLYWYDRYKSVIESIINLIISIALAVPFGINGIFIGTFVSTMSTCFWVEPLVVFRHALHSSVKPFFRDYAVNTVVTTITGAVVWAICSLLPGAGLLLFAEKLLICIVAGNAGFFAAYYKRPEFAYFTELLKTKIFHFSQKQ